MQTAKLLWKLLLRLIALCCVLITGYLSIGYVLGTQMVNADFKPDPDGIEIFILSNGVHTDIAVPTITNQKDWTEFLDPATFRPLIPENVTPQYISFGWGDKMLYEKVPAWSDLTISIAAQAMLVPSESAMHIAYLIKKPAATSHSIPIKISPEQYDELSNAFIESFALQDSNPQSLNCCFYPNLYDQFYASNQNYHILFTCNIWTNNMLKRMGVPTARWAPEQKYIMQHLNGRNLTGE